MKLVKEKNSYTLAYKDFTNKYEGGIWMSLFKDRELVVSDSFEDNDGFWDELKSFLKGYNPKPNTSKNAKFL